MARTNMHITEKVDFQCRNDRVLVKISSSEKTENGIYIPEVSIQGKKFFVVSKGPKVEDLEVGDEVLVSGEKNADYFPLPFESSLIMTKQENVAIIVKRKREEV